MSDRKSTSPRQLPNGVGSHGRTNAASRSRHGSARHDPRPEQQVARRQARILAAAYIDDAIEKSGKSKAEIAAALGVKPSRISNLIHIREDEEEAAVSLSLLFEIADVTGCPLSIHKAPRKVPVYPAPRRPADIN